LVEQRTENPCVAGSIPAQATILEVIYMFSGIITALITPFKNGAIDFTSLEKLIDLQIDAGVHAIIPAGTTGESPTLTTIEHESLIRFVAKYAAGKIKVVAGTGSNNTDASIKMSKVAQDAGCNGVMCVAPYYNKPTQEGLFQHYKSIHDAISIPIMLYSVPHRVVVDFSDDLIFRICDSLPRVLGFKDASGALGRPLRLKHRLGDRLSLLTGNDDEAVAFNAAGGVGCVSVISNITPKICKRIQDYCADGNFSEAIKLQISLAPIFKALFAESNPICVKYAASILGLCQADVRLPLCEPSEANQELIRATLSNSSF
jgi:4-hydroxy-tetrahydrodipicolinate synthase